MPVYAMSVSVPPRSGRTLEEPYMRMKLLGAAITAALTCPAPSIRW